MDKDTAHHIDLGRQGEELAVDFLVRRGHTILFRNWRYRQFEMDIITRVQQQVHFIEVKTRTSARFGQPEKQVNAKKFRYLVQAGAAFLVQHPGIRFVQYDIVSITLAPGREPEIFLIEDIFF